MSAIKNHPVIISNGAGGRADGVLEVRQLSLSERALRGAVGLGLTWLLAAMSVVLPGIHFVSVPLLLLAGPVVAFLRYRRTTRNERISGACPTCGRAFFLPLKSTDQLPLDSCCPPPSCDPIRVEEAIDTVMP
ncbi:MAG: hypothetical protein LBE62_06685 [Azonexus sp.]|jgi:hypothetical protein|nr:hypothetical protein [Azonexus sp.]